MNIYYIDGKKFTTNNYDDVPIYEISSLNEDTPAWENTKIGEKIWCNKGWYWHRLTGPCYIGATGEKQFYLNDKFYNNINEWLKDHPNPDLYFNAIGIFTETEKVLWYLQN
jgi:hypothetical protein